MPKISKPFTIAVAGIMLLLACPISSYAYEIMDTDGDGVNDTVRFSDGFCDPLENYTSYIVAPGDWIPCIDTERIEKMDENCKKWPGYIQNTRDLVAKAQEEARIQEENEEVIVELKKQIIAQCTNDSMSLAEKIQSLLAYLKGNYEIDESAPDYHYNTKYYNGLTAEFLTKERIMNEKNYRQAIASLIYNPMQDDMVHEYLLKENQIYKCYSSRNWVEVLQIEDAWYTFCWNTLELKEGFSEEARKNILIDAEIAADTTYRKYTGLDVGLAQENIKHLPEEIKQYIRDNGFDTSYCD